MLGQVSGIDPADIAGANNIINLLKERESLEIGLVERPR